MQNAKMSEFTEKEWSAQSDGLWKFCDKENEELGYREKKGVVQHEIGVVIFNQYQSWPTEHEHSANHHYRNLYLKIIHEGREYTRVRDAWYGEKTIARLANEFIEEIKGQEGS